MIYFEGTKKTTKANKAYKIIPEGTETKISLRFFFHEKFKQNTSRQACEEEKLMKR